MQLLKQLLHTFKRDLKLRNVHKQIDSLVTELSIRGTTTKEPVPFERRKEGNFKTYAPGESWGELFDCAWFNLQGKVPEEWIESDLYLKLDFNCELCLFNEKGVPIKGFTNKSSGFDYSLGKPTKRYFQVNDLLSPEGTLNLWIDAGLNDLFGNLKKKGKIQYAEVVTRNEKIRRLYYDLETLLQVHPKKAKEALKVALKENDTDQALDMTAKMLN